jgi:transcriptional regulator with XRE-family HTH domain
MAGAAFRVYQLKYVIWTGANLRHVEPTSEVENHMDQPRRIRPVDRHVGARIKFLRRALGMSQTELAHRIGLTFQQVQKYEAAANRVSASVLYEIAKVLGVPIADFFNGLPPTTNGQAEHATGDVHLALRLTETTEGQDVLKLFPELPSRELRKALAAVVRGLACKR